MAIDPTGARIQIRRGAESERLNYTPAAGELIYAEDSRRVYVGTGFTAGGVLLNPIQPIDAPINTNDILQYTAITVDTGYWSAVSPSVITDPLDTRITNLEQSRYIDGGSFTDNYAGSPFSVDGGGFI